MKSKYFSDENIKQKVDNAVSDAVDRVYFVERLKHQMPTFDVRLKEAWGVWEKLHSGKNFGDQLFDAFMEISPLVARAISSDRPHKPYDVDNQLAAVSISFDFIDELMVFTENYIHHKTATDDAPST